MSTDQMEAFIQELEVFRDRLRSVPSMMDTPHVLTAACYILAGQVDKLIRHVNHEIEAREITAAAMEIRRHATRN